MSFGIYVHIPYCIQRCTYCDFATYEQSKLMPHADYTQLLLKEIHTRKSWFLDGQSHRNVDTIYFGGGTPSLFSIKDIVLLLEGLSSAGYRVSPDAELTMELNPGTVTNEKLSEYRRLGFNRFSVGAQSFNPDHLRRVHREHSVDDTLRTIEMLQSQDLNFNFDLLFGVPHQTLDELKLDLDHVAKIRPPHISPYYLTVPEGHPLSKNRPNEDHQLEMFKLINQTLVQLGYSQYEISNYSLLGYESKHNYLYWSDQEYWGIGLSSHSYKKSNLPGSWGARFWNPNNIKIYNAEILAQDSLDSFEHLDNHYFEILQENQSLTDFCHTSLRRSMGLIQTDLQQKFSSLAVNLVEKELLNLIQRELVYKTPSGYSLTDQGRLISNYVFEKLTFLDPIPN